MGIDNYLAFIVTGLFLVMTPGMDTLLILNKSLVNGKKAGVYATLGISSGILVHTFLGAIGLSMLIARSPIAFSVVKYLGAAYIIYLGILKFKEKRKEFHIEEQTEIKSKSALKAESKNDYLSGLITNILNPKVAILFLAFFPQFINPDHLESPIPFILLGTTMTVIGIVWFLSLTFFSSYFYEKFKRPNKSNFSLNKISGIIFIIMGITIALADVAG
ncbi:LysE family translocator [Brumimicrobium glaciale]|uniref:LysE family translocator n=1 Tax=Brumimicrobium glaciale TaxID=200475 RepID=A0A4Q4KJE6_9FLAO|nr:LysE family translocator [Brumimicrobium glaciale]RYM32960.1 LysE family translocator [Brumimicrobium glaciale]